MTRHAAIALGQGLATVTQTYVVYRLPDWPDGVYGLMPRERLLPLEAETFEVFGGPVVPPPPQGALF